MLSDKHAFDQLIVDLNDAIIMRLSNRAYGMDKRFLFLMWLSEADVEAFADDLRNIKVRLAKNPIHVSKLYGQALHWMNDIIGVYRITAAVSVLKKLKSEDFYR